MKKRIIPLILLLAMLLSLSAYAASPRVMTILPAISFDGITYNSIHMFATVCLLANWISIKHGLPIGIIGVFVLILALELIAILNFDSSMNMILNPLCFNIDIIQSVEIALAKILSELVYLAILSIGITLYICRTDIF